MSGSIPGFSYSGIYSNPYWNVLHAFPGSDKELYCKLLSFPLISEKSQKGAVNFAHFINKKEERHTCPQCALLCIFFFLEDFEDTQGVFF